MKITNHLEAYTNYQNFLSRKKLLEGFNKIEVRHEKFVMENIERVCDYKGEPVHEDDDGNKIDWFPRLHYIEYKTTLRILPA